MSQDFDTCLIEDARIAQLTDKETFAVYSGPSENTFTPYLANSMSNSSVTFNITIPSENVMIDRHAFIQTEIFFQLKITNVAVGDLPIQYGSTESLNQFPFNSLINTATSIVNGTSTSVNLQQIMPMLLRMYDPEELAQFNSTTPCLVDMAYGQYNNCAGSTNSPLNGFGGASVSNNKLLPRGSFLLDACKIDQYESDGTTVVNSDTSTATTNIFYVSIKVKVTEPLLGLAPFVFTKGISDAGILGVQSLALTLSLDADAKRLFSSGSFSTATGAIVANVGNTASGTSNYNLYLGWPTGTVKNQGAVPVGVANTTLLLNLLSLHASQYARVSTRNVLPVLSYQPYINPSSSTSAVVSGASTSLQSQSIQLNQIPDAILICARYPMANQNQFYANAFMQITKIVVNFNNKSGILASATPAQLWDISRKNGSSQSWTEFRGTCVVPNTANGSTTNTPTTGSLLVLNPVADFGLPDYLSASSIGQFNFQFTIDLTNQFDYSITPELCICVVNSGLFVTQQGSSMQYLGLLNKDLCMETAKNPPSAIDSEEYKRMVGGGLESKSSMGMHRHVSKFRPLLQAGAMSAGSMSGGNISNGSKSKSKLAKHFM